MNAIEEVATANRESPRPVSQEKKTDSGTETAISAPDPSAVNATKQALLNAAVSVVGHTSPSKNDENKKETNASIPQQPPGLAGILASKKRPAAVRPDADVDADSSAYSGNSHHPHESSPNTARQSPGNATSPRAPQKQETKPKQVSPNSSENKRKSSAVDVIGSLKAQVQEKQKVLESLQSSRKSTGVMSKEAREIEEAVSALTKDFNQTKDALRIVGDNIVSTREESLSFSKQITECNQKHLSLQKNVINAFGFVESIINFKGKLNEKLQRKRVKDVKGGLDHFGGDIVCSGSINDVILSKYDYDTLVLIAIEMGKKLRVIEGGRVEAEKYVRDAKQCKSQHEALRKEHNEMQQLHLEQAKLIQTLQGQNNEIDKFKETALVQEKVIAKMQNIVETRLMPPMTADVIEYDGSNAHERVAEEIYKLNLMVDGERQRQKELDAEYLLTLEKKKEAKKTYMGLGDRHRKSESYRERQTSATRSNKRIRRKCTERKK